MGATAVEHLRDGRFQRSMSMVVALSSLVSGLEVGYEHYKGSYGNRVMYSPVLLSGALAGSAIAAVFSRRAAETALRWTSITTLVDGVVGFGFHIRGIARKPGGWRLPLTNIVMGPPILAPLLFGTAAYLGFIASYLRREEDQAEVIAAHITGWRGDLREGRFQKQLVAVSLTWAAFSGFEAWYSHYKSRFRIWAQWTPIILTPIHMAACAVALAHKGAARSALPASSAFAVIDGTVGFYYHVRGIARRTGGLKTAFYNVLYGPPVFAPLLFAACGMLGLLASVLRREGDR